jgi:hypothetical protein
MGLFDSALRPHLERVTKNFEAYKEDWLSALEIFKTLESDYVKNAERCNAERKVAAEKFREHGNTFMKKRDFVNAMRMYSESISAAIEGPLASMAYFNRLLGF